MLDCVGDAGYQTNGVTLGQDFNLGLNGERPMQWPLRHPIHNFHRDHNAPCLPPKFYINIVSVEFELQYSLGVFWALSRCLLLDDTGILLFFQKPTSDHREAVMLCLRMQFIQKTHCLKKNLRLVRKRNEPCSTDSAVPVKRKVQVISFTWHRHQNSKYSKKKKWIVRKFKGFILVLLKRSRSLNLGYVYSIPDSFCAGPKTIPEGLSSHIRTAISARLP